MSKPSSPMNIENIHQDFNNGVLTVESLAEGVISHYEKNSHLNCFIHFDKAAILRHANKLDIQLKEYSHAGKELPPLFGIPVAIKDNLHVQSEPTTCGSHILKDFTAPFDATVVKNLKLAGALICGKTNMDEFAMGGSTENSLAGPAKNPHNTEYVAGGSSGGSAICVSSQITPVAIGTDTGGSIRQPASYTGCIGFKPSYGSVSRFGLVAFGSSLDQAGPFAGNVADLRRVFSVISKKENPCKDMTHQFDFEDLLHAQAGLKSNKITSFEGVKVAIPSNFKSEAIDKDIRENLAEVARFLESQGARVESISIPILDYALAAYYIIATAEASSNLSRYDGIRFGYRKDDDSGGLLQSYFTTRSAGFGEEVIRRILLGTFVLSSGYYDAYYNRAMLIRKEMEREFAKIYAEYPIILTPTTPGVAFKLQECIDDPLKMYLNDICTIFVNLIGCCGVSIPTGRDSVHNLPIGIQFCSKRFWDPMLLDFCQLFEKTYAKAGLIQVGAGQE
ncbi:Asp-tRNA(Asn)/Glu-tRNA(Gln) amidotransferase subunit GatA [Candidatus Riflebacteria bacterium]